MSRLSVRRTQAKALSSAVLRCSFSSRESLSAVRASSESMGNTRITSARSQLAWIPRGGERSKSTFHTCSPVSGLSPASTTFFSTLLWRTTGPHSARPAPVNSRPWASFPEARSNVRSLGDRSPIAVRRSRSLRPRRGMGHGAGRGGDAAIRLQVPYVRPVVAGESEETQARREGAGFEGRRWRRRAGEPIRGVRSWLGRTVRFPLLPVQRRMRRRRDRRPPLSRPSPPPSTSDRRWRRHRT